MQIKLENPLLLSKVIELISNLVMEVKFKIDSSGMSVVAIDPANVAMVRFFLSKNAFSQFDLGNAKQEIWGVNLEDLIDAVEDCAVVADACSFIIENNNFIIEAKNLNSAQSEFSGDEVKI